MCAFLNKCRICRQRYKTEHYSCKASHTIFIPFQMMLSYKSIVTQYKNYSAILTWWEMLCQVVVQGCTNRVGFGPSERSIFDFILWEFMRACLSLLGSLIHIEKSTKLYSIYYAQLKAKYMSNSNHDIPNSFPNLYQKYMYHAFESKARLFYA